MTIVQDGFHSVKRRGLWRQFRRRVTHECNDLLETDRVLKRIQRQRPRDMGVQEVPIDRVIGSSGRPHAFDLQFNPRQTWLKPRWLRVAGAALAGAILPPVELLQVGEAYFVEDGHHRISVARWLGETGVRAHVMRIEPYGLKEDPACSRLGFRV